MIKDFFEKHAKGVYTEVRIADADFIEAVILVVEYDHWKKQLKSFLGGPLKDSGIKPSQEHNAITTPYGGINENQTLFAGEREGRSIIAMLWPWQDGKHITLKLKEVI
ncbi:MAG: hypothetical protein PHQ52_03190 [Candidatus Omnitrophica bacterium]|nr:hypothetical protein [Candidatus Omnitrophota bacterium]